MRLDIDFVNEVVSGRLKTVRERTDKFLQEMPCDPDYIHGRLESIRSVHVDEIRCLRDATWYLLSDDDDTETVQHLRKRLEYAVDEANHMLDAVQNQYGEKWNSLSDEQRSSRLISSAMLSAEYHVQTNIDRYSSPLLKASVWELTRYIIQIESGHLNLPDMLKPLRELRHRVETRIEEVEEIEEPDHD